MLYLEALVLLVPVLDVTGPHIGNIWFEEVELRSPPAPNYSHITLEVLVLWLPDSLMKALELKRTKNAPYRPK